MSGRVPWILVCEDDDDDFLLLSRAIEASGCTLRLRRALDGEAVLPTLSDSLTEAGSDRILPRFILMDLRMPRKDGKEALRDVKRHPEFRKIPVIVLTTSRYHGDIDRTYLDGANTFFTKPQDFKSLVFLMKQVCDYWAAAALPSAPDCTEVGKAQNEEPT
jgi:CheY-like chemotaxis protein